MANERVGCNHHVFLDALGDVWTVGYGRDGKLGHGNLNDLSTLRRVEELPPCTMVSGEVFFTACVTREGDVYHFGQTWSNALKPPDCEWYCSRPRLITGLPPIRWVSSGGSFMVCIGQDSSVWVFGENSGGQLGLGHLRNEGVPTQVPGISATQAACSDDHTLLLGTDGNVYASGKNTSGQLGSGNENPTTTFIPISLPVEVASVHCGWASSLVRGVDGTLWSTGENSSGQLGLGDNQRRNQFEQIPNLVSTQVACGWNHVVAIDSQHQLWGWGCNDEYQLSPLVDDCCSPTVLRDDAVIVLTGFYNTFVLTTDNQVEVCGYNRYEQLVDGSFGAKCKWTPSTLATDMIQIPLQAKRLKSARSAI